MFSLWCELGFILPHFCYENKSYFLSHLTYYCSPLYSSKISGMQLVSYKSSNNLLLHLLNSETISFKIIKVKGRMESFLCILLFCWKYAIYCNFTENFKKNAKRKRKKVFLSSAERRRGKLKSEKFTLVNLIKVFL